jgi:hypothetical protein
MSLPQHQADVEHNGNGVNEHHKGRGMFGVHVPHVPMAIPKKPEKPPMSLQVKNRESSGAPMLLPPTGSLFLRGSFARYPSPHHLT